MVLADKQAKQVQWTNVYLDALVCILQFMLQILFVFLMKKITHFAPSPICSRILLNRAFALFSIRSLVSSSLERYLSSTEPRP